MVLKNITVYINWDIQGNELDALCKTIQSIVLYEEQNLRPSIS